MQRIIGVRGLTVVGLSVAAAAVLAVPGASLADSQRNARVAHPAAAHRIAAAAAAAAFRARPAASPNAVTKASPVHRQAEQQNIDAVQHQRLPDERTLRLARAADRVRVRRR